MVAAWIWILAYVVAFVTFQVLLYQYLRGDDTSFEQATPDYGDGDSASRNLAPDVPEETDREGVQCGHCGAYNESGYTFCRECTESLDSVP